jgi:hypothetical protein
MTQGNRDPEAAAPDAVSAERLRGLLEERAHRADERDRVADEREVIAEERDQLADERERIADVREWQQSQARAPRPGDMQRRRHEVLKRPRHANQRDRARIDRLEARLARDDAAQQLQADQLEYDTIRGQLGRDNPDSTR